mgnify:CR=1 FL=1
MKKLTAILTSLIMTLSVICQTSVFAAFSDVGDDNTYKDAITTLTLTDTKTVLSSLTVKSQELNSQSLSYLYLATKTLHTTHQTLLMLTLHTGQRTIFKLPTTLA